MQLWEIIVLCAGIAFVVLAIFLIVMVKKLSQTVNKLNKLIADNTASISSIVTNLDSITTDTQGMVSKVSATVAGVDKIVGAVRNDSAPDYVMGFKKAFDTAGMIFAGIRMIKGYKERKKLKKLLKESNR